MIRLQFDKKPAASWPELVTMYPYSEFRTGLRSTLPLLDYWRDPAKAVERIGAALAVSLGEATLSFEYRTPVADGRGKASHTDLMINSDSAVIAVEAKYREPQYESVASWLGPRPTENRKSVLKGWLSLLPSSSAVITQAFVAQLPYQLIHRTASACAIGRPQTLVLYHLFSEKLDPAYFQSMEALAALCGSGSPAFMILHTPATLTSQYSRVLVEANGNKQRSELVRAAFLREPAYVFGPDRPVPIS